MFGAFAARRCHPKLLRWKRRQVTATAIATLRQGPRRPRRGEALVFDARLLHRGRANRGTRLDRPLLVFGIWGARGARGGAESSNGRDDDDDDDVYGGHRSVSRMHVEALAEAAQQGQLEFKFDMDF